jgi:hypothetical protein
VIPHGRELVLAVAAGLLWVLAVIVLIPYPDHARRGILELQGLGGEGLVAGLASLRLIGAGLLLTVAHVLSSRAHGTAVLFSRGLDGMRARTPGPPVVLAVRVLTWTAVVALLVGTWVAEGMVSTTDCFRTCLPFPD